MNPLLTPPSTRYRIHHPIGPLSQIVLPTPSADANVTVDLFSSGSTRPDSDPFQITTGPIPTRISSSLAPSLRTPRTSRIASSGALVHSSQNSPNLTPVFASRLYNAAAMAAGKILVTHPTFCLIPSAEAFDV